MTGAYRKLYEKLKGYDLIVFDMDGTLYFQKSLQIRMACRLIKHAAFHIRGFKELRAVLNYRKIREKWDVGKSMDEDGIFKEVSVKTGLKEKDIKDVIDRWMFKEPLRAVKASKDKRLADVINALLSDGKNVCIYSDYPAADKAAVLDVDKRVRIFSAGSDGIETLKPDPSGLLKVISKYPGTGRDRVIMVGDRKDRDGRAAEGAGVRYVILKRFMISRLMADLRVMN